MMTATATATFTKLKDGTWGVRAPAGVTVGQSITVAKRDGSTSTVVVGAILWTGTARDGRQASLVTIAQAARSPRANGRGATYERGVGMVCDECGDVARRGTRCWETGAAH